MFKNYLAVALRHLVTQKLYSALNVVGLSIGLACFILIGLFVRHELSYDTHWANADRIYRLSQDWYATAQRGETRLATLPAPAAVRLEQDFPQIEKVARIGAGGYVLQTSDGTLFTEPKSVEADHELLEIFDFEWLSGDPATALVEPFTLVLTRSAARKYFGDLDPVGQTLLAGIGTSDRLTFKVDGVIDDLPPNSHLDFTVLSSLSSWPWRDDDWGCGVCQTSTYVLLRDGADVGAIQSRSGEFFDRHFEAGSSARTGFTAIALPDIHLHSGRQREMRPPGNATAVYAFSAIATFILVLACINFTNLATAGSMRRAKEIGVRKAIGAGRGQVIAQFLTESVLLVAGAVLLSVALVETALPPFNAFMGLELTLDYLGDPTVTSGLALLALAVGLAAGSYPAYFLSAFEPARVLKGDATRGAGAAAFRHALVVLQFSISIALLIATAVAHQQMKFARGIELGYDQDRILFIPTGGVNEARWPALKNELLAHPGIEQAARSNMVPSEENGTYESGYRTAARVENRPRDFPVSFLEVDFGFFETYGIGLAAGRTFSEQFGTDRVTTAAGGRKTGAYVVNELAARRFGFAPDEAVGKELDLPDERTSGPIVGVVRDVYFESLRSPIEPTVYWIPDHPMRHASLRLTGENLASALAYVDAKLAEFYPELPLFPRFLDQDFDALYRAEERLERIFAVFSALAISIACLGLFGLASFATERRTKEIGVRKVMGGSILDIVRLFTGEFGRLVLLANLIAWPLAYVAMRRWLDGFAYRIDMSPWIYAGGALLALAIAMLTVGAVAAHAAAAKPIQSLRYE